MPYIRGTGRIQDVYHSSNVNVNNVPVALWLQAGSSAAFAGVDVSVSINIDPLVQTEIITQTNTLITAQASNPTAPNQFYKSGAVSDGVKGNYAPVEDGTTSTGIVSTSTSASDIIPFLTQTLNDASKGMWRETGQGGAPSNINITNIWTNLGYPQSGPWTSDQTAWCMGFINFALKASGYKYVQTASAAAITTDPGRWSAVQVPKDQAQPGDIAFWSYRHVNFVYEVKNGKCSFVGGNQSPKASNNPNDGDVTLSYPTGATPNNPNWVSCWRPSRS
jgi:hypothetical protein